MTDYIVEIPGNRSLLQIEATIAGEEATGAQFSKSSLSFHNDAITNLVTFIDLPPGQRPTGRVALITQGGTAPAGKASVWAGVMLVAGSNCAVAAYR